MKNEPRTNSCRLACPRPPAARARLGADVRRVRDGRWQAAAARDALWRRVLQHDSGKRRPVLCCAVLCLPPARAASCRLFAGCFEWRCVRAALFLFSSSLLCPVVRVVGVGSASIPMENPYCSCKLTRVRPQAKQGDLGSTLPKASTGVVWKAGSTVEVSWAIEANHGAFEKY